MRITVCTNLATSNLGNVALTRILQLLVRDASGTEPTALHRAHRSVLALYEPTDGDSASRVGECVGAGEFPTPTSVRRAGIAEPRFAPTRSRHLKAAKKLLVTPLRRVGAVSRTEARLRRASLHSHFATLAASDVVLFNPAGEWYSRDTMRVRRMEMDYCYARRIPNAVLNFSVTPDVIQYDEILPALERGAVVVPRDEWSADVLLRRGLLNVHEPIPDLVVLAAAPETAVHDLAETRSDFRPRIVLVPEGNERNNAKVLAWTRIVRALTDRGFDIVLASTEYATDSWMMAQIAEAYGAHMPGLIHAGPLLSLTDYFSLSQSSSVVVTSRLHAALLAVDAGVSVVAVDSTSNKVSAALAGADLGIPCVPLIGGSRVDIADLAAKPNLASPERLVRARSRVADGLSHAFSILGIPGLSAEVAQTIVSDGYRMQ